MYDSELQARLDAQEAKRKELQALEPNAHCTYFPMEQRWSVWIDHTFERISWHPNLLVALERAIIKLKERKKA